MGAAMQGNKLRWVVFALALVACNLSAVPLTPTPAPATAIPLFIPSATPLINLTGTPGSPTSGTPSEGSNPNCPLPAGWTTYTVETGDSMGLLAEQTDSSIAELTQANCLNNADEIYVGQVLYVPRAPVVTQ
jgi:nucleoid-associated protein YgaU